MSTALSVVVVGAVQNSTPDAVTLASPPGPEVTPVPGSVPDTSQPWWYVPYYNADRDLLRTDHLVGDIWIGPGVLADIEGCHNTIATKVNPDVITASDISTDISKIISHGFVAEDIIGITCEGKAVAFEANFTRPSNPNTGDFGGAVKVYRYKGMPAYSTSIPDERWREGRVAGLPAAIAQPILQMGLGSSAIVTYDGSITTIISVDGITDDDLITIAESILK